MGEIQEFYNQKETEEPFTTREKQTLNKRDRYFIRDIQHVEKINKVQALKIFRDYKKSSLAIRRTYRANIAKEIKYPDKGSISIEAVTQQREARPVVIPEKPSEPTDTEKLQRIYAHLQYGRYIPIGGKTRQYYDVETDSVVTRHAFLRFSKEQEAKGALKLPDFGKLPSKEDKKPEYVTEEEGYIPPKKNAFQKMDEKIMSKPKKKVDKPNYVSEEE